jgi:hypothetical protein
LIQDNVNFKDNDYVKQKPLLHPNTCQVKNQLLLFNCVQRCDILNLLQQFNKCQINNQLPLLNIVDKLPAYVDYVHEKFSQYNQLNDFNFNLQGSNNTDAFVHSGHNELYIIVLLIVFILVFRVTHTLIVHAHILLMGY